MTLYRSILFSLASLILLGTTGELALAAPCPKAIARLATSKKAAQKWANRLQRREKQNFKSLETVYHFEKSELFRQRRDQRRQASEQALLERRALSYRDIEEEIAANLGISVEELDLRLAAQDESARQHYLTALERSEKKASAGGYAVCSQYSSCKAHPEVRSSVSHVVQDVGELNWLQEWIQSTTDQARRAALEAQAQNVRTLLRAHEAEVEAFQKQYSEALPICSRDARCQTDEVVRTAMLNNASYWSRSQGQAVDRLYYTCGKITTKMVSKCRRLELLKKALLKADASFNSYLQRLEAYRASAEAKRAHYFQRFGLRGEFRPQSQFSTYMDTLSTFHKANTAFLRDRRAVHSCLKSKK